MAAEWSELSLREAGVQLLDCEHKTPPAAAEGHPYIAIPQIKNGRIDLADVRYITAGHYAAWTRKTKPQAWDVIVSRRCNPGETAFVPTGLDCALGQNLVLLRSIANRVYPQFLRWLLRSPAWWEQVRKFINVGAVFDSLKCADIPNFRLPFPPMAEQQAIACILGALDDKIELNRRTNRTLEGLARAIFQSWFVDFDPVRWNMQGRHAKTRRRKADQPKPPLASSCAGDSAFSPRIAALFPNAFENSELGEIPKGWRGGTVDDVAKINARTLASRDSVDVIDYIEISEVMRGEVATIARYTRGDEPSRARRRLQHGDTAMSTVRPDRGAYFLCLNPPDSLIASTGFAVLSSRTAHWAFLHALVTRQEIADELGRLADGGAYPAIRPDVIGNLPTVLPADNEVIAAYEKVAQPLFQQAEVNRGESRTLAALRDALLPKLISGELRVRDVERIVRRCI
jgi:type I restriction enzyme S subunit